MLRLAFLPFLVSACLSLTAFVFLAAPAPFGGRLASLPFILPTSKAPSEASLVPFACTNEPKTSLKIRRLEAQISRSDNHCRHWQSWKDLRHVFRAGLF